MLLLISAVLTFSHQHGVAIHAVQPVAASPVLRGSLRSICCSIRKVVESTNTVTVPAGLAAGQAFGMTASDGHEVALEVPHGRHGGDSLYYAEIRVPHGMHAGESLTIVVADPRMEVQVFDVFVPDDYAAGDLMVVLVDDWLEQGRDWDAAWASFAATQRREKRGFALLREHLRTMQEDGVLDTAHVVAATLLLSYAILCYALHTSGGVVLVPDGDIGLSSIPVVELNPIARWQLRGSL